MNYETVALDDERSALLILDQTRLPNKVEVLSLTSQEGIYRYAETPEKNN
jgi:methylthioribose-1-phosphate isomerase